MSKAFDRVSWVFMRVVLTKLGFSGKVVEFIWELVSTVSFQILLEGKEVGAIFPGRGLRQGDPISPYLFILVLEVFHMAIQKKMSEGLIHGVSIARGAPIVSNLFFADDCFIFCHALLAEAAVVTNIINSFAIASGQTVNLSKSTVSFSMNVSGDIRNAVCGVLGMREGSMSGSYLGLPSLIGRNKREILGFIKYKILGRIRSWTNRFLSKAGREILLKNVIQAIPTYAMSVFLLPLEMGREIERIMNGYWWGCEGERSNDIRWKRCDLLCTPKQWRGLGFRKIRDFNIALLGKPAWRIIQNPNSLMARTYRAKYFLRDSFFNAKLGGNPSFIWRNILESHEIISRGYRWRVGNGTSISVWRDPWLPNDTSPFLQTPMSDYLSEAKVESLLNMSKTNWDGEILTDIFSQHDVQQIKCIPIAENQPADRIIWTTEDKGEYTVKCCYRILQGTMLVSQKPFWTRMWKMRLPPKIKAFFWKLCSGILPTTVLLRTKMVQVSPVCILCNGDHETTLHLFVRCPFARQCWDTIGDIDYWNGQTFLEWMESNFLKFSDSKLCLLISVCWKIWEARNEKLWNHTIVLAHAVLGGAQAFLYQWLEVNCSANLPIPATDQFIKWEKPPDGLLKINVDAALDIPSRKAGIGLVIRNSTGNFIAARMIPLMDVFKPDEAEAIGVKEALKWLEEKHIDDVQVETDCLKVFNGVCTDFLVTSFDLIINDIREIARDFSNLSFLFVKRSANKVAHLLAREALSKSDRMDCYSIPFPFVVHVLELDSS